MPMQPVAVLPEGDDALRSAEEARSDFTVELEVFSGPLGLLLHLVESRQLDVLTVPLADLADAYVAYLATRAVDPRQLSEFVAIASHLIWLKSRRLLPEEGDAATALAADEPDEDELRRRLLAYRAIRDGALALGARDGVAPAFRREPRESDMPTVAIEQLAPGLLADALARLAANPEPEAPPIEVVAREVTIAMQIETVRQALAEHGRVVLQQLLLACRSRAEQTVTFIATLELVRRRVVRISQDETFGPILVEAIG